MLEKREQSLNFDMQINLAGIRAAGISYFLKKPGETRDGSKVTFVHMIGAFKVPLSSEIRIDEACYRCNVAIFW